MFNGGRKDENRTTLGAIKQLPSQNILWEWLREKKREDLWEPIFVRVSPENVKSSRETEGTSVVAGQGRWEEG